MIFLNRIKSIDYYLTLNSREANMLREKRVKTKINPPNQNKSSVILGSSPANIKNKKTSVV